MTCRQAIELLVLISSKQEANWAVSKVLDINTAELLLMLDNKLSFEQELKIINIKRRLASDEPIQYILGMWQFIDIKIITDKRALIPRPETEYLALIALDMAKKFESPQILDVGCGGGCIGLYLKSKMKSAEVELIDISQDALTLACENAEMLGIDCKFTLCDMHDLSKTPCDIIVSNPPYIKSLDINMLDISVKRYEPHSALDGGSDGLRYYRALAEFASNSLNENGGIVMEIGINQADDVGSIFAEYFDDIKIINDFNNIQRIITAER